MGGKPGSQGECKELISGSFQQASFLDTNHLVIREANARPAIDARRVERLESSTQALSPNRFPVLAVVHQVVDDVGFHAVDLLVSLSEAIFALLTPISQAMCAMHA